VIRTSSRVLLPYFLVVLFAVAWGERAWCLPKRGLDLPNFGQVTNSLYRGAQPSADGFARLQKMGVGLVINFRQDPSETALEKCRVESLGMKSLSRNFYAVIADL